MRRSGYAKQAPMSNGSIYPPRSMGFNVRADRFSGAKLQRRRSGAGPTSGARPTHSAGPPEGDRNEGRSEQDGSTGVETTEFYSRGLQIEQAEDSDVDPGELEDLRVRLDEFSSSAQEYFQSSVGDSELTDLDAVDIERLRELGYIR